MSNIKKEDEALSFITGLERLLSGLTKNDYEQRKVGLTNGPITVSTVYVTDLKCYETALQDDNNVYPVERYESREDALAGHERWITFARSGDGKEVVKLAYPGLEVALPSTVIKLKAMVKKEAVRAYEKKMPMPKP